MSGLTPFYNTFNDPRGSIMVCIGDSTTFGTSTTNLLGWPGALRSLANARWGTGSDGLHVVNDRNFSLTTSGDAWTKATTSDAWDCSMALAGFAGFSRQATWFANGSTKIATWTKPSYLTVDGFYIWAVAGSSAGNFSYSTDGGSSWTNVSATWSGNNTINRIRIDTAITGTNTVKVRAANAAGTAVNCYLLGIEPFVNKATYAIHNFGAPGEILGSFVRTTSGNWHAVLDTLQPPLVLFLMTTNDETILEGFGSTDTSGLQAQVETLTTTVTGYGGSILFMNFFEQPGRSASIQALIRNMIKSVAGSYGMPLIDFYDLVGNNAATVAAGYMDNGDIHPNDAGATFMAQQIWKVIGRPDNGVRRRV